MKIELVTKSIGQGRYQGLSAGQIIEAVARHGDIKDYGKLIKYLVKNAHWSPLEHMHYTFRVETSRAISAQIFRHKSLHFQEQSQRYDIIDEVEPIELRKQGVTNRQSSEEVFNPMLENYGFDDIELTSYDVLASHAVNAHLLAVDELYNFLIKTGVARECARMILPMGTKTVIHITGNVRDLLAFLNVRCDEHAQKEVRDIATGIGEILQFEMPEVLGSLDWRNGMFM